MTDIMKSGIGLKSAIINVAARSDVPEDVKKAVLWLGTRLVESEVMDDPAFTDRTSDMAVHTLKRDHPEAVQALVEELTEMRKRHAERAAHRKAELEKNQLRFEFKTDATTVRINREEK